MNDLYRWDNENLAIKLEIGCNWTDFETIYLPAAENLLNDDITADDNNIYDAFLDLKNKWESEKWGFEGIVSDMELVDISEVYPDINPANTTDCNEFDILIYSQLAINSDLYRTPWDSSPDGQQFCSLFAYDCMKGDIYSKDFAYSYCDSCGRTVCNQNPANGWHSQIHIFDGYVECNKCYEERTLSEGINEDFTGDSIPGQFYNTSDIEAENWVKHSDHQVGSGYTTTVSPQPVIDLIQQLIDQDNKVLVNIESMAIGGLGGYISIYTK